MVVGELREPPGRELLILTLLRTLTRRTAKRSWIVLSSSGFLSVDTSCVGKERLRYESVECSSLMIEMMICVLTMLRKSLFARVRSAGSVKRPREHDKVRRCR